MLECDSMQRNDYAKTALVAGLVLIFGYFGITKFTEPEVWISFIPQGFDGFLGLARGTWLSIFGVIELVLAAALLFPHRMVRKVAAFAMAAHLVGVLTQVGWNDVAVRDIGIMMSALALGILL